MFDYSAKIIFNINRSHVCIVKVTWNFKNSPVLHNIHNEILIDENVKFNLAFGMLFVLEIVKNNLSENI